VPEDLFRPSLEGAHHYAYVVENVKATVERLAEQLGAGPFFLVENVPRGLPEYLSAQLGEIDITFHDASASLGHDIEIHVDSQGLRDFFQMVREGAEGWDGSEPLRPAAT
jgi:hypothetical protein